MPVIIASCGDRNKGIPKWSGEISTQHGSVPAHDSIWKKNATISGWKYESHEQTVMRLWLLCDGRSKDFFIQFIWLKINMLYLLI